MRHTRARAWKQRSQPTYTHTPCIMRHTRARTGSRGLSLHIHIHHAYETHKSKGLEAEVSAYIYTYTMHMRHTRAKDWKQRSQPTYTHTLCI